ncbi:hypothetical protein [Dubosiella newyorkensis]|uniref:hypothetical protein n=1 Tax=Dubosiella newyorkensis TaxID=1862672 RepID=UPI003F675FE1
MSSEYVAKIFWSLSSARAGHDSAGSKGGFSHAITKNIIEAIAWKDRRSKAAGKGSGFTVMASS